MNKLKYYIFFILSIIISSLRPIFFKKYKDYFFMSIYLSTLSMYLGSIVYMYYESREKENYNLIEHIKNSLNIENSILSIISSTRFITKQLSYILLPLSISIPLTNLWIVSATIFDKVLYNSKITIMQYISIAILFIGAILINLVKIMDIDSSNGGGNYIYGIIAILISIISGGYIYTKFQNLVSSNLDPGYTMGIESGGSLIILTVILLIGSLSGLIKIPKIIDIVIMFVLLLFLFNISIIFKFIGFEKISVINSVFISQLSIILAVSIGFFYYNESFDIYKILGLIVIIIGSILGMLYKDETHSKIK